jgi:hypothetical protein
MITDDTLADALLAWGFPSDLVIRAVEVLRGRSQEWPPIDRTIYLEPTHEPQQRVLFCRDCGEVWYVTESEYYDENLCLRHKGCGGVWLTCGLGHRNDPTGALNNKELDK